MKRFICWLRFGHIWYDVGLMGNNRMMVQCRHCAFTRILNVLTGKLG